MAKKVAVLWKESIYKNGFRCTCGQQLTENNIAFVDDPRSNGGKGVFCNNCKRLVAYAKEVETNIPAGMYGDIEEYLKKKMS